jgi:cytochrome c-type biogenesis protein CcmH
MKYRNHPSLTSVYRAPAVVLLLGISSFCLPAVLQATDQAVIDQETNRISELTMSPFCPGRSLKDCPSASAGELKNTIRDRLLRGETEEQILQSLQEQYGPDILAIPPLQGFSAMAWIAPPVFLLVGGLLLVGWLVRERRRGDESAHELDG